MSLTAEQMMETTPRENKPMHRELLALTPTEEPR